VFLRGLDDGRGLDSGRVFGSYQADEFKSHNHFAFADVNGYGSANETITNQNYAINQTNGGDLERYAILGSNTVASEGLTSNTGGSETRPKNIAIKYFIKY
jgi:hypothetical protein